MVLVGFATLGTTLLLLSVLTGLGEHRRGAGVGWVLLAGLFFPITWVVWYVRDEHPFRRTARRAT